MSVVNQDILSGSRYPRSLKIQQVTAKDAARQFTECLSEPGKENIIPVGIAYYSTGKAEFMCLAQSNAENVLLISLGNSKFGSMPNVLCEGGRGPASKVRLVGFGMAQTVIRVCHATNLRVKGVDVLTLIPKKCSPSEFVMKMADNNVKNSVVQRLWTSNKASAQKDAVLRAWLAAWYVPQIYTTFIHGITVYQCW
jgi:hypothetical protein